MVDKETRMKFKNNTSRFVDMQSKHACVQFQFQLKEVTTED